MFICVISLYIPQRSEWLPRYDEEGIRVVLDECGVLWNKVSSLSSIPEKTDDVKVSLVFHSQCMLRDKKYLDRYGYHTS